MKTFKWLLIDPIQSICLQLSVRIIHDVFVWFPFESRASLVQCGPRVLLPLLPLFQAICYFNLLFELTFLPPSFLPPSFLPFRVNQQYQHFDLPTRATAISLIPLPSL